MSELRPAAESEPIVYRVRVSKRARRLQLQITAHCEVEVVLPQGMSHSHVAPFVASHREWIRRTLARQMATIAPTAMEHAVPVAIHFAAVGELWTVDYHVCPEERFQAWPSPGGGHILLHSAAEAGARRLLQHWLSRQARLHLVPWLQAVSHELGLDCRRVSVRGQRSRWGSCSSRGTISINRALLFLESALVRHLFVHELCHMRHMNHSPRFWRLVESHSPRCRELEQALNRAVATIPRWALTKS